MALRASTPARAAMVRRIFLFFFFHALQALDPSAHPSHHQQQMASHEIFLFLSFFFFSFLIATPQHHPPRKSPPLPPVHPEYPLPQGPTSPFVRQQCDRGALAPGVTVSCNFILFFLI